MPEARGDESSSEVQVFVSVIQTTGTGVAEGIPATFTNNNLHFNLTDKTIITQFEPSQKSKPKPQHLCNYIP